MTTENNKQVVESTPLIIKSQSIADEENVINATKQDTPKRRWRRTKPNDTQTLPSWKQAFAEVLPFLRPRDGKHYWLAALALLTVLLEKLITVLPPLAIKHAVDAISEFSSSDTNDASIKQKTAHTVTMSIAVYFLLRTLDAGISSLQSVAQRTVSLDAERRFATELFKHMQHLGAAYHLERHAGELLRILSRGADATSTIIDSLYFNLIPTLFEAVVVATVFWKLLGVPSIAGTTIVCVILYLIYTVKVTNTRLEQRRKVLDSSESVSRIETETLVNYETVVMFGREQKEVEEYDVVRQEYTQERVKMLSLFACLQLGQQSIRLAGTCIGLYLAGRATVYGQSGDEDDLLSPGSFVVVQLYIQQLFQPLSVLGFTYRQLTEALTDLEKAVKMLRSKPLVKDEPGALAWDAALEEQQKLSEKSTKEDTSGFRFRLGRKQQQEETANNNATGLTFDNVSFQYKIRNKGPSSDTSKGGRRGFGRRGGRGVWNGTGGGNFWLKSAKKDEPPSTDGSDKTVKLGGIKNVSFHIPAGKTAALVGPSGSGKTTITRLILRMYDTDSGGVLVDNLNVKSLQQESLRSNIGIVAQETVLFHSSLRDNIVYGKENATDEEVWEAVKTSALEPLVKSLPEGLETLVGERGMKLSGGERQRVGLARCIIKQPKLILLDEATSSLDSGTEKEIQRNIFNPETSAKVMKGRTALMIAHRLSTARRADIILVLDKGKLVEQGTHDELLALGKQKSKYARMWSDQMEGNTLDLK